MEDFVKRSLLYDFYGEMLTEHQKEIYESYVLDNLSLAEIAENAGISRQGAHDIIHRCNNALEGYESRLHLIEKFLKIREMVTEIENCSSLEKTRKIAQEILEYL